MDGRLGCYSEFHTVTHQEYGVEEQDAAFDHLHGAAALPFVAVPFPIRAGDGESDQLVFRHFSLLQCNFIAPTSICRR